jgi:hypothetical protein
MEQRPPFWLIAVMVLEALFALWLLYVGMSYSGTELRAGDVLIYSAPLMLVLAVGGLSWWLWMAGKRSFALFAAVGLPLVLLFTLVFLLGVGL